MKQTERKVINSTAESFNIRKYIGQPPGGLPTGSPVPNERSKLDWGEGSS